MAEKVYYKAAAQMTNVLFDWDAGGFKAMLVTAGAFNPDHDFRDDIASELVTTGYTAGGVAITGYLQTIDATDNRVELDCDDIAFGALTSGTATAMVVYKNVGSAATDWLVGWYDTGYPKTFNGGTFTYTVDAQGLLILTTA